MKIRQCFLFLLVVAMLSTSFAIAEPKDVEEIEIEKHQGEMGPRGEKFLIKALGLSEEQAEKIKSLNTELDTKVTKIKIQIEMSRLEIAEMLLEETIDKKSVYKKSEEINKLHAKIQTAVLDHYFSIIKILDKEQKKKFTNHYVKRLLGHGKGHIKRKGNKK